MSYFLENELSARDQAIERYKSAQKNAEHASNDVKLNARLLVAKPMSLLAFFGAGAYKGVTSDNPSSKRRQAVFALLRTTFLNILH